MTPNTFNNYSFTKNTQVKFRGEWSPITEVWFREGKIGVKNTGHLVHYWEIEDIKDQPHHLLRITNAMQKVNV